MSETWCCNYQFISIIFLCTIKKSFCHNGESFTWFYFFVSIYFLCLCFFRAIVAHKGKVIPLSRDFTPESERQRLQLLVRMASSTVSDIVRQVKDSCC